MKFRLLLVHTLLFACGQHFYLDPVKIFAAELPEPESSHAEEKSELTDEPATSLEKENPAPTPEGSSGENGASGQQITLTVREKGSGLALSKVEVQYNGEKHFTDPKGQVRLEIESKDRDQITVYRRGYETEKISMKDLSPAEAPEIFLKPVLVDDGEVIVVKGKNGPQISRTVVSIEESKKIAPSGDPAQVVKLLPGVQTAGVQDEVIVRGSGPDDSRYFIDDLEVPTIFHDIGNLSVIPGSSMEAVQFDAGGFGSEFGDATGGIIVIRTVGDIPDHSKTEFVVNVPYYSGIYHTRPLSEDSALTLSVRRSYLDAIINQYLELQSEEDQEGAEQTFVPYFSDALAIYQKNHQNGYTKSSLIAAYDGLTAAFDSDRNTDENGQTSIEYETGFVNFGIEHMHRLSREWKLTTTPQIYYLETDADVQDTDLKNTTTTLRIPTHLVKRRSKHEFIRLGFDLARKSEDFNVTTKDTTSPGFAPEDAPDITVKNTETAMNSSAWASLDKKLAMVVVTPGARLSHNSQIEKWVIDPRLRTQILLNDSNTIKAAVGRYSQSPSIQQGSEDFGNPDLDFAKSIHYVLGFERNWGTSWTTSLQTYYKTIGENFVDDEEKNFVNTGDTKSYGAEVFLRKNLVHRWFGWFSYTYSKTEERDNSSEEFRDSEFDQTHVAKLVANYQLSADWDIGGRYEHNTGSTYSAISEAIYNATTDQYEPDTVVEDENSKRMDDYNSISLYLTKKILFNTWKLQIKGGIESYWPQDQVLGISYNYDYSEEVEQSSVGSIPFLEVTGEF